MVVSDLEATLPCDSQVPHWYSLFEKSPPSPHQTTLRALNFSVPFKISSSPKVHISKGI